MNLPVLFRCLNPFVKTFLTNFPSDQIDLRGTNVRWAQTVTLPWNTSCVSSVNNQSCLCFDTQTWSARPAATGMVGSGYLEITNSSRSWNTVIKFLNPHANFPLSSPPLFHSPAAWPSPLLSFPLLFLISDPAEKLGLQFLQLSSPVLYTFLSLPASQLTLRPLPSPTCPLLLLDYPPQLVLPDFALSSQMKKTLSVKHDPSQGHIVSGILHMKQIWTNPQN